MPEHTKQPHWSIMGAIGTALAASACCTVPLTLVSLGIGGAWVSTLTTLEPFRPLFITLALGMLGFAAYRSYRAAQAPTCACRKEEVKRRIKEALIALGTLATLALIASPWLHAHTEDVARSGSEVPLTTAPASVQEVMLHVERMTCAGCAITVSKALVQVEGVIEAKVTYDPAQALVRYDTDRVTIETLTRATANAGYPSSPLIKEDIP